MTNVPALLELEARLQTSNERIEQSSVIIVRAGNRAKRSAQRLLRSQSICIEARLCASLPLQTEPLRSA
jgi:hypothetical protein